LSSARRAPTTRPEESFTSGRRPFRESPTSRRHLQPRRILALVLALAGLTLTAAACSAGASTGSSATPSSSAGKTYTNAQYKFSITPDPVFTQGKANDTSAAGSSAVFDIAFADASGTKVGGSTVDGVQVSVYKLTRALKPSVIPKLKKEFAGVVNQLMSGLTAGKIAQPLRLAQINGVPGFRLAYTFKKDTTEMAAITYSWSRGSTSTRRRAKRVNRLGRPSAPSSSRPSSRSRYSDGARGR